MARKGQKGTGRKGAGNTMGQIHAVFAERLSELKDNGKNQYKALQGADHRKWQVPMSLTKDLFEIASLHNPPWERTPINTNYEQVMQDPASPGTNGDAISLKLQMDYNAAEERAFRVRHSSICRSTCHAMGRRYGQGEGRVFPAILEEAAKMIAAGGAA